jgi:hypothetical protein
MGKNTIKPIDANLVRSLFEYQDGGLFWAVNKGRAKKGDGAYVSSSGYKMLKFNRIAYLEHRLIWAWHGNEAVDCLDHINGNCLDNRIENLRPATQHENMRNSRRRKDNKSGVKGVCWSDSHNGWRVVIASNKKQTHVGYFKCLDAAREAATNFRLSNHKQFANVG